MTGLPSPIVPTGHAVLDVSLALNASTHSYGIRINKDGAARVVVVDFSDHEVMALGAIRVGDVILSVQGFDATRASFGEVVGRIQSPPALFALRMFTSSIAMSLM